MLKFLPRLLGALLGLGLASAEGAAPWFPPISGELSGDFTPRGLPGIPKLHWRMATVLVAGGWRDCSVAVDTAGARLKLSARVNASGDGTWRIEEGQFDVAAWVALLAPQVAPALVGAKAEGRLMLGGEGEVLAGRLTGRLKLEWLEGALRHAEQGWALEGAALRGEFTVDSQGPRWASVTPLELTVRTIKTSRFGARNLVIAALLDERLAPTVSVARVEAAGGEVTAEPFTLPLDPLVVGVKMRMSRIGLQDVVALVPASLSDARGRIDGEVRIDWSKAKGLRVGAGQLTLRDDEPTTVRLTPAPGLLSRSMPERFALLPAWTGPLARWFSPVNPGYADLRAIELGQTDLRVETLAVQLTPEGDARGRSAHIELTARPAAPGSSVGRVSFEVDVSGPIAEVLRLSMQEGPALKIR